MGAPSDAGSAYSGSEKSNGSRASDRHVPGDDAEEELEAGWETGIFGTLFTVSKEKHPHLLFVAFRLLLDVVQLLLMPINPAYGFVIDKNNFAWKVFSFLQLNSFMTSRGYTFFLVCLYLMVAGLTLNVGLCVWVSKSFANNSFGHIWPIVWLRLYSLIFYQVLDLATFTLLLMSFDCGYFAVPDDKHFIHQEFPDVACFTMPHIAHVGVSGVALVVFMVLATAFTVAEIDLNPKSGNLLGMGHTKVEGISFFLKFIMSSSTVFLNDIKWLSIVLFVASGYLLWLYFYWEPHMNAYVNHVRVASSAMVFYTTWLLVALAFPPNSANEGPDELYQYQKAVTAALWAGLAPAAALGWLASYLRLRFFMVTVATRFLEAPHDMKPKFIHKFTDPREVEIAARVVRVWLDEDTLDPEAVQLAERILKAGKAQLPASPFMTILWSSFLIDVKESYITGYQQLQLAKKAPAQTWIERFAIFVREQEHAQKATAASAGDSENVDLVSYVEFQRNYSVVLKLTMEAMITRRSFWQALESHKLARFDKLSATVARIDASVRAAERMFKQVLARHSNSVKILQLYVKFLQGVKNDPWGAARWSAEAEKMQKAEEESNTKMVLGQHGNDNDTGDEAKGIIVISANCIIRMVNDVVVKAFGYEHKQAMVGHNVNTIIPPPFAKHHNSYVRNYITTGQTKMLGNTSNFVALHKDKYVVPIRVVVTHLSGIGEDSLFMGVVELIQEVRNEATVWLLSNGNVLSCNAVFTDWLGYKQNDITNRKFSELVLESSEIDELLVQARTEIVARKLKTHASSKAGMSGHYSHRNRRPVAEGEEEGEDVGELDLPLITATHDSSMLEQDAAATVQPLEHNTHFLGSAEDGTTLHAEHQNIKNQVKAMLSDQGSHPESRSFTAPELSTKKRATLTGIQDVQPTSAPMTSAADHAGEKMCWRLEGVHMRHLLSDETVLVDMEVNYGSVGDHVLYVVQISRADHASGMMLVTDKRGRVKHATEALAKRLGTTVSRLHAGGATHAIDSLIPGPLVKFHHAAALQEAPATPTPWGCRAGLPIYIPAVDLKGLPELQAYTLTFEQRTVPPPVPAPGAPMPANARTTPDVWHVVTFNPTTMGALWDARRLKLTVSNNGTIISTSSSHTSLFGFDVTSLVGSNVSHVLDILRAAATNSLDSNENTAEILRALADRNRRTPGISWRVGVSAAIDPTEISALGIVGDDIAAQLTKPAIMNVRYLTAAPRIEGARVAMPTEIQYEIELWRTDLMVGLMELDPLGHVCSTGVPGQAIYYPCSLLGAKPGLLMGAHVTTFLPVKPGLKPAQALFTEGGILPSFSANVTAGPRRAGGMKSRAHKAVVGPTHVVRIPHYSDCSDVELRITPVCKGAPGTPTNIYLIIRAGEKPSCGRLDFMTWLLTGDDPALLPRAPPSVTKPQWSRMRGTDSVDHPSRTRTHSMLVTAEIESPLLKRGVQFNGPPQAGLTSLPTMRQPDNELAGLEPPDGKEGSLVDTRLTEWLESPNLSETGRQASSALPDDNMQRRGSTSLLGRRSVEAVEPSLRGSDTGSVQDGAGGDNPPEQDILPPEMEEIDELDNGVGNDTGFDQEAGAMADYKRGKRYKKLSKVLSGKEIHGAINRLAGISYLVLGLLLAMEIAAYVSFSLQLKVQDNRINALFGNAKLANEANNVLMYTQALEVLMSNKGVPGLRYLQNNTAQSPDMTRLLTKMSASIAEVVLQHQGLYHGYDGNTERMPEDFGLRGMWEEPYINLTFYQVDKLNPSFAPLASSETVSLWAAGNLFITAAKNLVDNGIALNQSGPTAFSNLTDTWFIKTNGPVTLNEAYRKASAALLSLTLARNQQLISSQKVVFTIQAILITAIALITIIIVAEMLSYKRHRVYQVFTRVPVGVVHGLASATLNMVDGDDAEEEEEEPDGEAVTADDIEVVADVTRGVADKKVVAGSPGGSGEHDADTSKGNTAAASKQKESTGTRGWRDILCCCLPKSAPDTSRVTSSMTGMLSSVFSTAGKDGAPSFRVKLALYGGDRGLSKSYRDTLWLAWPLMVWAIVIIVVNIIGHRHLAGMEGSISNLNIGGGVFQAIGRTNNYVIMISAAHPNRTLQSSIIADLEPSLYYLKDIYGDELYGQEGNPDDVTFDVTGPHPSEGVAFEGAGFDILFDPNYLDGCLCLDRTDCLTRNSTFYTYTSNGLDAMLQRYFLMVKDILALYNVNNATLSSAAFKYIWEVGCLDLTNGRRRMSLAYVDYVHGLYGSSLQLHMVSLIFSVVIVVGFVLCILRPFLFKVRAEPRRVAELLASLPPEIEVESMVRQAVMSKKDAAEADLQKSLASSSRNFS